MPVYEFGSGVLVGRKIVSSGVVTPREFGVLQDVMVDFNATSKPLHGQYQFPVAVGRGSAKISGKARFARVYADIYNDLFFNSTIDAATQVIMYADEAATIPGTPFTVTVTHVTGGIVDMGVKNATTGVYMKRVSSAPATGEYSLVDSTGVYTFAAADTTVPVYISYTNALTGGSAGTQFVIGNPLLGNANFFEAHLKQVFGNKNLYLRLNSCISTKLTFATKLEDFMIPELDFEAFADSGNNVGLLAVDE